MDSCSLSTLMICFYVLELSQNKHVIHKFSSLQAMFEYLPFYIDSLEVAMSGIGMITKREWQCSRWQKVIILEGNIQNDCPSSSASWKK